MNLDNFLSFLTPKQRVFGALGVIFFAFPGALMSYLFLNDQTWLAILFLLLIVFALTVLVIEYRKALSGRTAMFTVNSVLTSVLVIAIAGVVNFLANSYQKKIDLTSEGLFTLSDQAKKIAAGLPEDTSATLFTNAAGKEKYRLLFDNFKAINPNFKVEYVDPMKESAFAQQQGVKQMDTLLLKIGQRTSQIVDPDEEKLTNTLIKLTKDKQQTFCTIAGHGERSFDSEEADGYSSIRDGLKDQAYEIRSVSLAQEGKVPADCDAIGIVGPTGGFIDAELKMLDAYFAEGGRAVIALDLNIKGRNFADNLKQVIGKWYVDMPSALTVDLNPIARIAGGGPTMPIIPSFSKDSVITRDFRGQALFPMTRPLTIRKGSPASVKIEKLAQTLPSAWGETNLKGLGERKVKKEASSDIMGPLSVAMAVEGKQKDSKAAKKDTRLVIFGTSLFATNRFAPQVENYDLFMNSVTWLMEDESLISIRKKEAAGGTIKMSASTSALIAWIVLFFLPVGVSATGITIWIRRRKL